MTVHTLSEELLSELSSVVANRLGLSFPKERWHDLERGIYSALKEGDIHASVESLISTHLSRKQLEILASCLTIGETYFFRDKNLFDALETHIFPELINTRRGKNQSIRIWSAGCSTGEEPYSIAVLLDKLLPDINKWNITILAADINPHSIGRMKSGVYGSWSFRDTPDKIKQEYFTHESDGKYCIREKIKKMVTPLYLNLAEDSYPSLLNNTNAMDIIICRNVLMYFTQPHTKKVIKGFYHSLVEKGWLIVSPTETSQALFSKFRTIHYPSVILYKKEKWKRQYDAETSRMQKTFILEPEPVKIPEPITFKTPEEIPQPEWIPKKKVEKVEKPIPEKIEEPVPKKIEEHVSAKKSSLLSDAQKLYKQGFYEEAVKKIAEYFDHNYQDADAHTLLTRIYANTGKLREAFACCEKAISLDKLNPSNYYLLASVLQEQKRFEDAALFLKRAIYLDQNFVIAHLALGNIMNKLGNSKESKKSFRNALILLKHYKPDTVLPESDGMTAERLIEIIQTTNSAEE